MAAEQVGDIFSDDGLDAVLSAIDGNFLEETPDVMDEVEIPSSKGYVCTTCSKICVSKRGLTRHEKAKHQQHQEQNKPQLTPEQRLHPMHFLKCVKECSQKLSVSNCYPTSMLQEFETLSTEKREILQMYNPFREVFLTYRGKPEEYYPKFYKIVNDTASISPFILTKKSHLVFGYELANYTLAYLSDAKFFDNGTMVFADKKSSLSDREKAIITYLGGYVISTLYRRIRFSKVAHSLYQQQSLSILLAAKSDESTSYTNSDVDGKLVSARQRGGGLWRISKHGVSLFSIVELEFRYTAKKSTTSINAKEIVSRLIKNSELLVDFNRIKNSCDEDVSDEVALNLLEDVLTLYVRVRAFSYAKDIKISHDISKGKSRATKSLRGEIKKASSALDQAH